MPAIHRTHRLHGVLGALQHGPGFLQKNLARIRQPDRLGSPLQESEAEFVLEVANLPADRGLGDMELRRGARDVFLVGYGHEVSEMSEFHAPASMPFRHRKARNMVFPPVTIANVCCGHDHYTQSQ